MRPGAGVEPGQSRRFLRAHHPGLSPHKPLAVACCDVVTDREGNPAFRCRFPGCEKTYASRDAVRKHGRINHLQWLRSCEFEHSAAGQRIAAGAAAAAAGAAGAASPRAAVSPPATEHVYAGVIAPAPAPTPVDPVPLPLPAWPEPAQPLGSGLAA